MTARDAADKRILVVDDDRQIRELMRRLLEESGYICSTVDSAAGAAKLLASEPFALVLADLQMPGESGLELISRLHEEHPETATIMVTGVDDPTLAQGAIELGAYGYIVKPFSPTQLAVQVMNALVRRKLERAQRSEREFLEQTVEDRTLELRTALENIKRSEEETVTRLAAAVAARDHETSEHIERVAAYSALVARRLGLPQDHCALIRRASTMHDVGKIGVADGILLKPGPLSDDERRAMQGHAAIGHDILAGSQLELLDLAARIAWTHHERVDGTGYPRGLFGTQIPLEGRIVAVVDVYDALTSHRPYRSAMSHDEALTLLAAGRDTQFDPIVLDAFLGALEATAPQPAATREVAL
jgi:putative two-component system response regulator